MSCAVTGRRSELAHSRQRSIARRRGSMAYSAWQLVHRTWVVPTHTHNARSGCNETLAIERCHARIPVLALASAVAEWEVGGSAKYQ
jgi:hypothetical protein